VKLTIICKECGQRNELIRRIFNPEMVCIVCRTCEAPIKADVTAEILLSNRERVTA
jgi:predicted nucleic acid-binding Zn ribbon protein